MRVARKVMAVSELAWDLENDPRAEPLSAPPSPAPVDVNAAVENEMKNGDGGANHEDASVVRTISVAPPARPLQRVRVMSPASSVFEGSLTKRMTKIDQRLLAIARGDVDPDGGRSEEIRARDRRLTPPAPRPTLVSATATATATEALSRSVLPDHVPTKPVPPRFASAAEHHAVELRDEALAGAARAAPRSSRSSGGIASLDDPFGGLIPVNDEGEAIEVDDSWLEEAEEPEPFSPR